MLKDKFQEMLAKKRDLSEPEKMAKMDVLKDLRGTAQDMMGDRLGGLKKVSVMSDSPEGLEKGLEKAQDMLPESSEEESEESPEHEASESPEMEAQEHEDMPSSPEEIDAKIAELLELKKQLEMQSS